MMILVYVYNYHNSVCFEGYGMINNFRVVQLETMDRTKDQGK